MSDERVAQAERRFLAALALRESGDPWHVKEAAEKYLDALVSSDDPAGAFVRAVDSRCAPRVARHIDYTNIITPTTGLNP